jgi:hypothetical protein
MTRSAAHITDVATPCDRSGETIEEFPVERLVLKLVENSARVLLREPIVAFAN